MNAVYIQTPGKGVCVCVCVCVCVEGGMEVIQISKHAIQSIKINEFEEN